VPGAGDLNKNAYVGKIVHILLIEDEPRIADFVRQGLQEAGFTVQMAADGPSGLAALLQGTYDLVVLDGMLPGLDGFELLGQARQQGIVTPVIMLSARGDLPDRLRGFELGADDYLPKPFFTEELIARIRAVVARRRRDTPEAWNIAGLTLNRVSRKAQWHATSAVLSQREFSLLGYLMRSPGHIFSRKQILQQVWDINFDPQTNVVDVCIQRIRKKLTDSSDLQEPFPIEAIRGVGYRLRATPA
jgi:DNA-binding response OmpR family regulator